jgi:hypothetical protein
MIEHVAVEDSLESKPVVKYMGRVVLDKYLMSPYMPRKALCRKSFPVHDACTYVFGLDAQEMDDDRPNDPITLVSAATKLDPATGPWTGLMAVTSELILLLREQFLRSPPRTHMSAQRKRVKW